MYDNIVYLGYGVYAQFGDFSIGLIVNDHRNEPAVYLEPAVLEALNDQYRAWRGTVE